MVPEGLVSRDGIDGPQAAIKVTIINMADIVVILFNILLLSSYLYFVKA